MNIAAQTSAGAHIARLVKVQQAWRGCISGNAFCGAVALRFDSDYMSDDRKIRCSIPGSLTGQQYRSASLVVVLQMVSL